MFCIKKLQIVTQWSLVVVIFVIITVIWNVCICFIGLTHFQNYVDTFETLSHQWWISLNHIATNKMHNIYPCQLTIDRNIHPCLYMHLCMYVYCRSCISCDNHNRRVTGHNVLICITASLYNHKDLPGCYIQSWIWIILKFDAKLTSCV